MPIPTPGHCRKISPALLGLVLMAACGPGAGPSPPPRTYTVRGEVVELPAVPGGDLVLHHEAIDSLQGVDGRVWGMDAMVMPFSVGAGVSLDGLQVGDKVAITLRVDWLGDRPHVITGLQRLPPETELVFRRSVSP